MIHQPSRPHSAPETSLMDDLGDAMTGGMWRKSKGLTETLIHANSMLIMSLTRIRMGAAIFNYGLLFWTSGWLFVITMISQENWRLLVLNEATEGHHYSGGWIWLHGTLFTLFYLAKWLIAKITIGSNSRYWFRDRLSIGESLFYFPVRWILKRFGLIDHETSPRTFWKINHRRWLVFWEPILFFILAHAIKEAGYGAYGNMLIVATCCMAYTTFQAAKNADLEKQAMIEAGMLKDNMDPTPRQPTNRPRAIGDR